MTFSRLSSEGGSIGIAPFTRMQLSFHDNASIGVEYSILNWLNGSIRTALLRKNPHTRISVSSSSTPKRTSSSPSLPPPLVQ